MSAQVPFGGSEWPLKPRDCAWSWTSWQPNTAKPATRLFPRLSQTDPNCWAGLQQDVLEPRASPQARPATSQLSAPSCETRWSAATIRKLLRTQGSRELQQLLPPQPQLAPAAGTFGTRPKPTLRQVPLSQLDWRRPCNAFGALPRGRDDEQVLGFQFPHKLQLSSKSFRLLLPVYFQSLSSRVGRLLHLHDIFLMLKQSQVSITTASHHSPTLAFESTSRGSDRTSPRSRLQTLRQQPRGFGNPRGGDLITCLRL